MFNYHAAWTDPVSLHAEGKIASGSDLRHLPCDAECSISCAHRSSIFSAVLMSRFLSSIIANRAAQSNVLIVQPAVSLIWAMHIAEEAQSNHTSQVVLNRDLLVLKKGLVQRSIERSSNSLMALIAFVRVIFDNGLPSSI